MENNILATTKQRSGLSKLFLLGLAMLYAIIFAKNVLYIPVPASIILLFFAALAIIGDRDEIIALMISCIPLSVTFQYKYALFACILVYLFKYYGEIKLRGILFPLLLMMFWELLHGIGYEFSLYEFFRDIAELVLCAFFVFSLCKEVNYALICRVFVVSCVFIMTVILLRLLIQHDFDFLGIFTGSYRFGVSDKEAEQFGVNFNPNALGFICNLGIVSMLQLSRTQYARRMDYLLMVIMFGFGVLTMSRAFVVCFAVIVCLYLVSGKQPLAYKAKRAIIVFVLLILVFAMVFMLMPEIVEKFFDRFTEADVSNGRIDLFKFYNRHIFGSLDGFLFGSGLQDIEGKFDKLYPDEYFNVPHNGIQELIVVWGVPGLLFFIWFLVEMIITAKRKHKLNLLNLMPIILLFVNIQFGQLISAGIALMVLCFSYVSLYARLEEKA